MLLRIVTAIAGILTLGILSAILIPGLMVRHELKNRC